MGFLSTLFGGGEAYDEIIGDLNKQKTEATSYYKSMSKMNALDSSENQAALRAARELLTDSTRRAAATQAVTGASDAALSREEGVSPSDAALTLRRFKSLRRRAKTSAVFSRKNLSRRIVSARQYTATPVRIIRTV